MELKKPTTFEEQVQLLREKNIVILIFSQLYDSPVSRGNTVEQGQESYLWLLFAMLRKNKEEPQCLNQYSFTYLTVIGRASVLGLRVDEEDIDKAIEASQGMNYPGYFLLQKVLKRY